MPKFEAINLRGLLAVLLLSFPGCATQQWCQLPDDAACALNQTQLGWELQDVCQGACQGVCQSCATGSCGSGERLDSGCGVRVYDDAVYLEEPVQARQSRIEVGPPPIPYKPPMPPKFLPVPVSNVWGLAGGG